MVDANRPLTPIPMDDQLLELAQALKDAGLPWEPQVGCFVWDPQERISSPSPFPKRIYFILSMKRFLAIFGDTERMKQQLVWLPTWYQIRQMMGQLNIDVQEDAAQDLSAGQPQSAEAELKTLYRRTLRRLESSDRTAPGDREAAPGTAQGEWIRAAIISDLGDISRLPSAVKDRIEVVYHEVAGAYLGWRRIQEGQADDWLPQETSFGADLLCGLGHFYSDYQTSIKSMDRLRKAVHLLNSIDARHDRDNYDRIVALALERDDPQPSQGEIMDCLQQ